MKFKMIFIAAAFVAVGCGMSKMKESGAAFMEAWKAGDAGKTYALLEADLQKELGELEGWKKWATDKKPASYSFSGFNVNANGTGTLSGSVETASQQKADLELHLKKHGEDWKVMGISLKPAK